VAGGLMQTTPDVDIGRRLQERRRTRGNTQQQVADRLGVSRPTVAAIEAGQRRFTPEFIVRLAEAYGVSVSNLVRSPAPPIVELAAQFRLPHEVEPAERGELEHATADLEELVGDYLYLEQLIGAPMTALPSPPYRIDPDRFPAQAETIAETERRRLGLGEGPLYRLRDLLEREVGMRIFSLRLPRSVAGLFAAAQEAGPCVAINADHPNTRQRWTLGHEFGHYLTSVLGSEVTRLPSSRRISSEERFAEAFAGAFLMPRNGLQRRLTEIKSRGQPTVADLLVLAGDYEVSPQALVLRLEDLGLVGPGLWDRLQASRLDLTAARAHLGVEGPAPDGRMLPARFMLLAIEAYEHDNLSERQLADLLHLDRLSVREILRSMARAEVESGGEVTAVEFDLSEPA
jgi:Zn-dependent peptidase ImmA (M78 family)/DNA-binding XRE family transcriptional regulator